jgi:hypothetical protein
VGITTSDPEGATNTNSISSLDQPLVEYSKVIVAKDLAVTTSTSHRRLKGPRSVASGPTTTLTTLNSHLYSQSDRPRRQFIIERQGEHGRCILAPTLSIDEAKKYLYEIYNHYSCREKT